MAKFFTYLNKKQLTTSKGGVGYTSMRQQPYYKMQTASNWLKL